MNRSGHSRHKSHSQSVQCTSPQPLSTSAMTSQSHSTPWRHNSNTKNVLWAHVNGTEIILKSTDRRSNPFRFLYVQGLIHGYLIVFISRVIRSNCFSKMWRISLPRILQNNDLQCWLKTAGVITNDGFSECIILYNALCTMHAGETMYYEPCYNMVFDMMPDCDLHMPIFVYSCNHWLYFVEPYSGIQIIYNVRDFISRIIFKCSYAAFRKWFCNISKNLFNLNFAHNS